jgi:hypothetical protein
MLSSVAQVKQSGILRVHLLDNTVLRELGLDNTFKSLQCNMESTVEQTIEQMKKKMRRALSGAQAELLDLHCQTYALYLDVEDSGEEFGRYLRGGCAFGGAGVDVAILSCCSSSLFVVWLPL